MDVLTKHKISKLENEINSLRKSNNTLIAENKELKQYIEENQVENIEKKMAELNNVKDKFDVLNAELESCRQKYDKQIKEIGEIKSQMIKDFSRMIKGKIRK